MGKKRKKRARARAAKRGGTRARRADKYDLYEKAVQEPEADLALMRRIFKKHFARPPRLLREDFCGTAYFACQWVANHPENRAWGIDLDPQPLEWGRKQHVSKLRPEQAARVKLIEGNVLDVGHEKVDVTVAFNFSFFTFDTRAALRRYLEAARETLAPEGLLLLDAYGGADSQRCTAEKRKVDDFTYVWDQHSFDPISHRVRNYIHFEFPDRSRLRRAFRYDWRLWTIPEMRELLHEAGFRRSEVYWEGTDHETGEGNGVFRRAETAPEDPAWICYVAAFQ
jgi:hypothetical protein